jgi:Family of unknown function (DUF6510)
MSEPTWLDGNAAAGPLREVFAVDLAAAVVRCNGCGTTAVLGEANAFMRAPGTVARCRACDMVLLRLVRGPTRAWLDLRGVSYLEVALPER